MNLRKTFSVLALLICAALPALRASDNNPAFNSAYRLHQPPEVRFLMDEPDEGKRSAMAVVLAGRGFLVDVKIMIWGWDAFKVMSLREQYGLAWDAPFGAPPIILSPGPGQIATDFSQPAPKYALKTSTNIADYPVFDPPPPPVIQRSYIGPWLGGNFYASLPDDPLFNEPYSSSNGRVVTTPAGTFVYSRTPWGGYYLKQ